MKKILIAIIIFMIPIIANATSYYIAIDKGNEIIYDKFDIVFKDWHYYFKISPFGNYEIKDEYYLNNIAFAQGFYDSPEYFATIQMLIYKTVHPEYNIYLVDENFNYYDNTEIEEYILNLLEILDSTPDFANNTYYLENSEEVTLSYNYLSRYIVDDYEIINDSISFKFTENGIYEINFDVPKLEIKNNYYTVEYYYSKPFSIKFVVEDYYDLNIKTYNNDKLVDNNIYINEFNYTKSTIRLPKNDYEIIDNYSNTKYNLKLDKNKELTINNYFINKIKTNIDIYKICDKNKCYGFSNINDTFELSESLTPKIYNIYTSDNMYQIDLRNKDNYEIDNGILTYNLEIDLKEEIIDEEIENNNNEDTISINIPNTLITYLDSSYYYVKEKYYNINNINYNNYYME